MNLFYFTNYFPPQIGAASNMTNNIVALLAKKGFKIHIFSRGIHPQTMPAIYHDAMTFHPNITVHYSSPKIPHPYNTFTSHFENLEHALQLSKVARPDLILSQYHSFHYASIVGGILAKRLKIPHIIRSHDIFSPYYGEYRNQAGLLELAYLKTTNQLTYKSIRSADHFLVTATEQIQYLKKDPQFQKVEFHWSPNGVDPELFYPQKDDSLKQKYHADQIYLYIGMLDIDLGIHEFIKSLPSINQEKKDTHFVIVGEGKDAQFIREYIKKIGLERKVHIIPPVPHNQIPYYINNSDVGVGFLAKDQFYKYCVPVKCLEYMACKKPFITTPISRDVLTSDDTGLLVDPLHSKEIANKSITLLDDSKLRNKMGNLGFAKVQNHFLLNSMVKRVEDVLMQYQ